MVTLNNLFESYSVRPLNEGETIQSFNCGDTELNDFIINRAAKYRDELLAVSYVGILFRQWANKVLNPL
jgi:hypothetical protein